MHWTGVFRRAVKNRMFSYLLLCSCLIVLSTCSDSNPSCPFDAPQSGSCARISATGRHQIPPPTQQRILEIARKQRQYEQAGNSSINNEADNEILIGLRSYGRSLPINVASNPGDCDQNLRCSDSKFRTADGSCNNLVKPRLGKSLECLERLLDPEYADDRSAPRIAVSRRQLPSARSVSLSLHQQDRSPADVTHMLMQYGQFLDHDISMSPVTQSEQGAINCCNPPNGQMHEACFRIAIPQNDPFYSQFGERCMNFVRSATCLTCNNGFRQQISVITSFIDASNVYGSSKEEQDALRTFDRTGGLRTSRADNGGQLLPASSDPSTDQCSVPEKNMLCFQAGDGRVNQQAALVALHTTWLRQHNRIASNLRTINPRWDDERLFQATRRIIGAQMQMIAYNEFLPLVLGKEVMDKHKLRIRKLGYTSYRPDLNPRILNEFSTAAYRFGHSLISGTFSRILNSGSTQSFELRENWFNPFVLYNGDMDSIMRGLVGKEAQRFDPFFDKDVSNHLYKPSSAPFGLDLVSINIQRGRDHGIAGYTKYVQYCSQEKITSFEQLDNLMPVDQRQKFQRVYRNVDDIDLYSGGMSELPGGGSLVGPTFACIMAIQFKNIKFGDRYWFEHQNQTGSFSTNQLRELRKTLLSKVICANGDDFQQIHGFVMQKQSDSDPVRSCSEIPDINLAHWRDGN